MPRLNGTQIASYSSYPASTMRNETFFNKNENYIYWYENQTNKFKRADISTLANVTVMGGWSDAGYLANTYDPNSNTALIVIKTSGIYRLEPSTMVETLLMSQATFDGIVGGSPTLSQCTLAVQGPNNTILIAAVITTVTNQIWVFDPAAVTLTTLFDGGIGIYLGGLALGINSSTDITFASNATNSLCIFNRSYAVTDEISLIAGAGTTGMTDGIAYQATFGDQGFSNGIWRGVTGIMYANNHMNYQSQYVRWVESGQVGTYPIAFQMNNFLPKSNLAILIQSYNLYLYS